jgi:hypothetical protein
MQSFEEKALEMMHEEFNRTGGVRPKITVLTNAGQIYYFDYNGTDEQMEKARLMIALIIKLSRICGRFAYGCFSSEAWLSRRNGDPMLKLRASEDPNKEEGVFCITWDGDKRTVNLFEIKRTGSKAELVKQDTTTADQFTMWIDSAFEPIPPDLPLAAKLGAARTLDKMFPSGGNGITFCGSQPGPDRPT